MGGGNGDPNGPLPFPLPGPQPGPHGRPFTLLDMLQLQSGIKPAAQHSANLVATNPDAHASSPVPADGINTFQAAHDKMHAAPQDIAPNHSPEWQLGSHALQGAHENFQKYFGGQKGSDGWRGVTGDAIRNNALESLAVTAQLAAAAGRMGLIVDMFSQAISRTREYFNGPNWQAFEDTVINGPAGDPGNVKEIFDGMAAQFLTTVYRPLIDQVNDNHPDVTGVMPPPIGSPAEVPGGARSGGARSGSAGVFSPAGLGSPALPNDADPASATPSGTPPVGPSPGGSNAGQGLGDAAQKGTQAAQNAAGQAANAAQEALGNKPDGARTAAARLPEGVLGLGPKGLTGATKGGGGAHGAGGAADARPPLTKPVDARMVPPSKQPVATPAARAGVGSTGAPGAGAPAAGHRSGGADKVHKVSKALYQQKHGEEVVGETEAVIPVIGEVSDPTPSGKRRST